MFSLTTKKQNCIQVKSCPTLSCLSQKAFHHCSLFIVIIVKLSNPEWTWSSLVTKKNPFLHLRELLECLPQGNLNLVIQVNSLKESSVGDTQIWTWFIPPKTPPEFLDLQKVITQIQLEIFWGILTAYMNTHCIDLDLCERDCYNYRPMNNQFPSTYSSC